MTLQSSAASDTQLKCLAPCDTELRSPLLASITLPNWGLSFSWTNCPTWGGWYIIHKHYFPRYQINADFVRLLSKTHIFFTEPKLLNASVFVCENEKSWAKECTEWDDTFAWTRVNSVFTEEFPLIRLLICSCLLSYTDKTHTLQLHTMNIQTFVSNKYNYVPQAVWSPWHFATVSAGFWWSPVPLWPAAVAERTALWCCL